MSVEELVERFWTAMESADVDSSSELFAPDVCWGPPGDPDSGCHNREEVLAWYRAARDLGVRAEVTEIVAGTDRLLVGLRITGSPAADDEGDKVVRWQVLSLRDGVIADIRGYDDRESAATQAGITD